MQCTLLKTITSGLGSFDNKNRLKLYQENPYFFFILKYSRHVTFFSSRKSGQVLFWYLNSSKLFILFGYYLICTVCNLSSFGHLKLLSTSFVGLTFPISFFQFSYPLHFDNVFKHISLKFLNISFLLS